tara:strand:+ start:151952 stop:152782 length:831 start_codon:yes stop_codon:yes gene_type:complete
MLKYRILTAIVLIPFVLWGVLKLPSVPFQIVVALSIFLGGTEWANLTFHKNRDKWAFLFFLGLTMSLYYFLPIGWLLPVALVFWLFPILTVLRYRSDRLNSFHTPCISALSGFMVLGFAFMSLCYIQAQAYGGYLLLTLFAFIWMSDTAAYFVGRALGQNKLSPVSPGKTIEGCLGGVFGSAIVGGGTYALWHYCIAINQLDGQALPFVLQNIFLWLGLGILIAIVSILGDLFESLLKRNKGAKDSGRILPGHGGILDRIDSLLPTLPIFAFALQF